jgi:uncharacterized membrane protein YecN with MAPEG domain
MAKKVRCNPIHPAATATLGKVNVLTCCSTGNEYKELAGRYKPLILAVRAHANTMETVPIALLLGAIAESCGAVSGNYLHPVYLALLIGRLFHFRGMTSKNGLGVGRRYGMLLTWTSTAILSLCNLVRGVRNFNA